jgi:ABC-type nitrate/sulfonate/bicarbonate transport system ATPase subunit
MNSCPNSHEKLLVSHLQKTFDDTPVINDVSLKLKEKEFVSLLGLSGSGKSTIFNIISGLILPDEGEILIDGANFTGITGRVSYMYQKDLLLPWKNIIDNVSLPLQIKGDRRKKARGIVEEYFDIFGLKGFEYKYPFQLSGGMRQRAALMRTFFFSRDIMLLDEPFGGLDAITRSRMQSWLLEVLPNLNSAVLFITHDIEEAIYLSDRIYILSERPARVKEEITVDFPKPRNYDITTTESFNALKKHILDNLGTVS